MERRYTRFQIRQGHGNPFIVSLIKPRTVEELRQQYYYYFTPSTDIKGVDSGLDKCMRITLGFPDTCTAHWASKVDCYCSYCQEQDIPAQPTPKPIFTEEDENYLLAMRVKL